MSRKYHGSAFSCQQIRDLLLTSLQVSCLKSVRDSKKSISQIYITKKPKVLESQSLSKIVPNLMLNGSDFRSLLRSNYQGCSLKKAVLENFAKFTEFLF